MNGRKCQFSKHLNANLQSYFFHLLLFDTFGFFFILLLNPYTIIPLDMTQITKDDHQFSLKSCAVKSERAMFKPHFRNSNTFMTNLLEY